MTIASATPPRAEDTTGAIEGVLQPSLPPTSHPFAGWLRLQLALSATALMVVLFRSAQIVRLSADTGAVALWGPILATQAAFWLGWSIWAGILVRLVRRLVDRPPSRAAGVSALIALAILPPFVLPVFYAPVHWLMFNQAWPITSAYGHMATHDVLTNVLLSATLVGVVYGYLSLQRARRLEVAAAQLNEQLTRAQLNPHFLFNSLNSVAVLARRGRMADVEHMVTRLADLLRHSLEASRTQLVPMRVELEAVRRYLDIEQVRFADRLQFTIDVADTLLDVSVPSFLLQPLVENAVRHGPVDTRTPVHLTIQARANGPALVLTVSDDGAGIADSSDASSGIGLTNTRARLAGLYGDRASLSLSSGSDNRGTVVTITLPIGTSDARAQT